MEIPIRQLEEQIWRLEESRDIDVDLGVVHREVIVEAIPRSPGRGMGEGREEGTTD